MVIVIFFFNDTATTEIYTLSLHDALPICCHGLEVISGGLAPDLRYLEAEEYGDEWYMERFISGYTQNGITKMPAFGELLGQDAAWAIRSEEHTSELQSLTNLVCRLLLEKKKK